MDILESDWKLFRKHILDWQESYMGKLIEEYILLLQEDKEHTLKFWTLEKRINEDKKHTGVQIQKRRSTMVWNIVELIGEGAIRLEDLNEFSEDLKNQVKSMI